MQGFGVALATTIIGLVLRVYFSQSRPDLAESESTARLELAAATGRLKAELSQSVVSLNDFSRQTRQALEELRDEVIASTKATKEAAERALEEASQEAASTLTESSKTAVSEMRKLSTATTKVVSGMEMNVAALSSLELSHQQIAGSLKSLEHAAGSSQSILKTLDAQSQAIAGIQNGAADTVRGLAAAASSLNGHVGDLNASAGRLGDLLVNKLAQVEAVPRAVAESAMGAIGEAIDRLRFDLESIVRTQASITEGLSEQAKLGADTIARHNEALEAELAKSRENVAKVHSALVEMTGQLAARAEAHPG